MKVVTCYETGKTDALIKRPVLYVHVPSTTNRDKPRSSVKTLRRLLVLQQEKGMRKFHQVSPEARPIFLWE